MCPIRRTLTSIKRYKGRTFILFISVLLMGVLIKGSMITNQAIDSSITQLQRSMPLVFSVAYRENWELESDDDFQSYSLITRELVHEIGNLPYVKHFDYTMRYHLIGYYSPYFLDSLNMESEHSSNMFRIHGVSRPEVIYIESGMYELYAGRLFTETEVQTVQEIAPILVSREFATVNHVSLGSIIHLTNSGLFSLPEDADVPEGGFAGMYWNEELWNHPYNQSKDVVYEFEVVGIFEFTRIERGNVGDLMEHQAMTNLFFTPNWRVHEAMRDHAEAWSRWADVFNMHDWADGFVGLMMDHVDDMTPLWVLNELDDATSFIEAANDILPTYMRIDDSLTSTFRPMIEATDGLNVIVGRMLWLGSGAMIVVLTLLILTYLRERKHELGIYLALGERKVKLIFQILFEVVLVSSVGLILALFISEYLAEYISLNMLRTELAGVVSRSEFYIPSVVEWIGFGQEMTPEEMLAFFEVSLNIETIALFFTVGFGTIILATIVPVVYILELSPKDILMQAKIE